MASAPPTLVGLATYPEEFQLVNEHDETFMVQWAFKPEAATQPTSRESGITGWAKFNGLPRKIHICKYQPCNYTQTHNFQIWV